MGDPLDKSNPEVVAASCVREVYKPLELRGEGVSYITSRACKARDFVVIVSSAPTSQLIKFFGVQECMCVVLCSCVRVLCLPHTSTAVL